MGTGQPQIPSDASSTLFSFHLYLLFLGGQGTEKTGSLNSGLCSIQAKVLELP